MNAPRTALRTGIAAMALVMFAAGCMETGSGLIVGGDPTMNGGPGDGGSGDGGSGDDGSGGAPAAAAEVKPSVPTLFVADKNGGVMSFKNPSALDGDVAPATRIFGTFIIAEGITVPAVDRTGSLLGLSPDDGIVVFANAETATGDLTPGRRISGSNTGLTHTFTLNSALIYDRAADRAFACNSSAVLVWDGISNPAKKGNLAPDRVITSPDMKSPRGIALGPNGDLYVTAETQLAVFKNGAARDGNIPADRIIEFLDESSVIAGTTIGVGAVTVDAADRLYVFDPNPGAIIFVLDDAASLDGVVKPNRTIDIDLPVTTPGSIAPDFFPAALVIDSQGTGYVSDFGEDAIHIIPDIGTRDGLLPVGQTIAGPSTKFDEIGGLFIWE